MRILHVENDEMAATAVGRMLQGVVEECAWTELGENALEMALERQFDLILLDIMLPDIDGYELIRRMRSADVQTPCLILSGLVDRDSKFANLALGVRDYVVKPFSRSELISGIQSVVEQAKQLEGGRVDQMRDVPSAERADGDNRRKTRRFATVKSATIDFGDGVPCRIVNISHSGAALRLFDQSQRLPRSFMLRLESGESRFCRLCWRDGDCMGVKFIDQ